MMLVRNCIDVWQPRGDNKKAAASVLKNLLKVKLSSTHVGVAYFVKKTGNKVLLCVGEKQGRLVLIQIPKEADYFQANAIEYKYSLQQESGWNSNLTEVRSTATEHGFVIFLDRELCRAVLYFNVILLLTICVKTPGVVPFPTRG